MATKKLNGAQAIAFNCTEGTIVTTGTLIADKWYRIATVGAATALPSDKELAVFKTPLLVADAITLATGDSVWPLTLDEVCKVDMEMSGEMGVIDVTDSCDAPYNVSIPDGYVNLSGSINTMMRFDKDTGELADATQLFVNKFFDIMEDDNKGVYTFTPQNTTDLLFAILLNKEDMSTADGVANYLIIPVILSSLSMNIALKDAQKGDYSWSKGQGPATYYKRHVGSSSEF